MIMTDLCKTALIDALDHTRVKQKEIAKHLGITERAISKRKKTEKGAKEVELLILGSKVKKMLDTFEDRFQ